MRILFALPGLHRYERGAEVALLALATELAEVGDDVTIIGSGQPRTSSAYRFVKAGSIRREAFEAFPRLPVLRSETAYEEASFVPGLLRRYAPRDYDVTVTCSYPFTNWALRRPVFGGARPPHVFITQNGDWPATSQDSEYRYFNCEGLVCTNPDFYERNRRRWRSKLIPNGVDVARFGVGPDERQRLGISPDRVVVLMVSALIPSKRVGDGISAVAKIPNAHLLVAGDGPLRDPINAMAEALLPQRFTRVTVSSREMPALYRSADVFLHLSIEESFGNVFLEALACGLPLVGHDSPRLRWIVGDGEHLLDTRDFAAVATTIEQAHRGAPALREARAQRASQFAWKEIAKRYREFFEEILSSGAGKSATYPDAGAT